MSRIVVVTLPERGHYHPLLGPAEELTRRGHDVSFACVHDVRATLTSVGVERVHVPPNAAPPTDDVRGAALAAILVDAPRLGSWIRRLLVEASRAGIAPLRAIFREVRPDVVAIDTMAYDAAIAAELEGIPWVGWATSLNPVVPSHVTSTLIETLRTLDPDRHQLFRDHGIEARFRVSDVLSPRGTATFAHASLVAPNCTLEVDDPTVYLVGPSLGGTRGGETVDVAFAGDRRVLYASFGSQAWHQPTRFERLVRATERTGWAMVAATGELAIDAPAHVRRVAFADQRALLARVDAMVTHGGANSIMEACTAGVPLLVAPICNDQPHGAAFVARSGNGLALDLERCTDDELDHALRRLADDATLHGHVERVRRGYASCSGPVGAADLVERACR